VSERSICLFIRSSAAAAAATAADNHYDCTVYTARVVLCVGRLQLNDATDNV